jgi:hypothetical protein
MSQRQVFGGALGFLVLLFVAPVLAVVFFILLILYVFGSWLLTPHSRPCPRCGCAVRNGETVCGYCNFDFDSVLTREVEHFENKQGGGV